MEITDEIPNYSVPEHKKTPLALCKLLFNKIPLSDEENFEILDPFTSESEMSTAIRILNPENSVWMAGNSRCEWDGVKIEEHRIDWVIGVPNKDIGYKTAVDYFCGKSDKGVALLTDSMDDLDPERLDELFKIKGVYMWKIVVCSLMGKTHYFTIFKNRCCKGCNNKMEGCCPDIKPEERNWKAYVENKEHMAHHHHNLSPLKPRFDFLDFIEGTF